MDKEKECHYSFYPSSRRDVYPCMKQSLGSTRHTSTEDKKSDFICNVSFDLHIQLISILLTVLRLHQVPLLLWLFCLFSFSGVLIMPAQKKRLTISRQSQKTELPLADTACLTILDQTLELLNPVFCSCGFIRQRHAVFSLMDDSPDYSFLQGNLFLFL